MDWRIIDTDILNQISNLDTARVGSRSIRIKRVPRTRIALCIVGDL